MTGDLCYVLRGLRRRPGFAATIVVTLALGLGLGAGIFSFADGYLFRPLPFPSPEQLYRVRDPHARIALLQRDTIAHRIELCANLADNGVTPPDEILVSCVNQTALPVFALIRPRAGSFVFTADEVECMLRQARQARALGARGLVVGALDGRGRIDATTVAALVREAGALPVTYHRAFDRVSEMGAALDELASLGVSRVVTSGGAPTALQGAGILARLVRQAGERIVVVAGGGVRSHNVRDIVARTGVREVHGRFGSAFSVRAVVAAVAPRDPQDVRG